MTKQSRRKLTTEEKDQLIKDLIEVWDGLEYGGFGDTICEVLQEYFGDRLNKYYCPNSKDHRHAGQGLAENNYRCEYCGANTYDNP